jgi:cyclopropane fatty-acyl-phospholipid synthase-like methyltransferase
MGTKDFNILDKIIAASRLRRIVDFFTKNDRVLDFGCGVQGYLLRHIKDKIKLGIGIDYDVEDQKEDNLTFIKTKFTEKLKFNNGSFDKVTALAVIEHIDLNVAGKLFAEINRVLVKEGMFIITTPTPASKPVLEFLASIRLISLQEICDHKKYYSKADLLVLAHEANLELIDYRFFQLGLNSVAVFKKD